MKTESTSPTADFSLVRDKEMGISEKAPKDDLKPEEDSSTPVTVTSDSIEKADESEQEPSEKPEADVAQYPTGLKLVTLVIALCLAVFLVALDQTIIATAIPKITDHFNSISDIGWYGSSYFLTSTSLQPTFGRIYKVFNVSCDCCTCTFDPSFINAFKVKTVFLIAIGVFELGSLVCALAPSSTALIIGRAVAGMGVGGIFSGGLVIIAHSR